MTVSPEPGTLAPVPPVVVPQIVVSIAVMVQAVLHVRKRFAALATSGARKARERRKRPKNLFMAYLVT
jgi:hypothetical protein